MVKDFGEHDSSHGIGLVVIWVWGDDLGELGWWENIGLLGEVGIVFGIGYTKSSTKGRSKTCSIELTSCVWRREEKKFFKKGDTYRHVIFF